MTRGATLRALTLAVLIVAALVPGTVAAQATNAAQSAMLLRDGSRSLVRVDGGGATVTAGVGTSSYDSTTVDVIDFQSQVTNQSWTMTTLEITAGLAPGTYATSRLPGVAAAVLDPGGFDACGGDEPGTLTINDSIGDDGTSVPTSYSASFDVAPCDSMPALHGEIRYNSTDPLGAATAPDITSIPAPVVVNSTADLPVTIAAAGNAPITLGAATLQQKTLWDGSSMWTISTDDCANQTLEPGESCQIDLRFGSKRPDGTPYGTEDATVVIPDGHSQPALARVEAKIAPLPGQPIGLAAEGLFRHTILTWGAPPAYPPNWDVRTALDYQIYQVMPDGTRRLAADTHGARFWRLTGLPDNYTATYLVTATQGTSVGPDSVPSTMTTASSEDLLADQDVGAVRARTAPDPEDKFTPLYGSGAVGLLGAGTQSLSVSRNQAVLGYARRYTSNGVPISVVGTTRTDDADGNDFVTAFPPAGWDTDPALSPDGTKVVYSHAAAQDAATDLRIAGTKTGSTPTDVPGSSGLYDAVFGATGASLVAVQPVNGSTRLVSVEPTTGAITAIGNSEGLSEPDVAADGRIVAVRDTDAHVAGATGLVLLPANSGAAVTLPAAQSGTNIRPRFSSDGTHVFYVHNDTTTSSEWGAPEDLDLVSGMTHSMADGVTEQSPFTLAADDQHQPDVAAPKVTLTAPATTTLGKTVIAGFKANDPTVPNHQTSGFVADFDVRYRTATASSALGGYIRPTRWQHFTSYSVRLPTTAGDEYCFSVRARDLADNVSTWTKDRCTVVPIDDRGLTTSAQRRSGSSYYQGTYTQVTKMGATLSRSGVMARRIGVLVGRCSTCGSVDVRLGRQDLGVVNTKSRTTKYQQALWLPMQSAAGTGTLTLEATNAAPVRIDGVLVLH